jgi:hypothetical protein
MLSLFFYFWPISLTLLVATLFTFWRWFRTQPRPRMSILLVFSCLVFPFVLVLYGVIQGVSPGNNPKPYAYIAPYVIYGLLITQLVVSGFLVYKTNIGARVLVTLILTWELLFSFSVGLIATMSISGVWW